MGGTVPGQRGEVIRVEERAVPNLDAVAPARGQLAEEAVQRLDKDAPPLEFARGEVGELKDQKAYVRLELPARTEER